ncbi:MAG TPA: hypothetical protein VHE77_12215 [Dongiaceae bacterium]|jgi:hypothetical protein|nr:hypothetical protein [Dongiaceae bacterium]
MLNSTPNEPDPRDVERIVREGPSGAVALAGLATLIVVAIWFAFYFFVFSPRALP